MMLIFKNISIVLFAALSIYFISSCQEDKSVTYLTSNDLGILRTDEQNKILGGDFSDWCIHTAADTFTYMTSFTMNAYIYNTVARLKWTTKQEYHCFGFDVERKRNYENNYIKLKTVSGQGIQYDTTNYIYSDTVNRVSDYTYRLKVIDIYGNYKYVYYGQYYVNPPLNYSFGPAYPNPASGYFTIPFSVQWKDTISIYIINNSDTIYISNRSIMQAGTYKFTYYYDTTKFGHSQKRIYIKCNSLPYNDACRNYGDIEFN